MCKFICIKKNSVDNKTNLEQLLQQLKIVYLNFCNPCYHICHLEPATNTNATQKKKFLLLAQIFCIFVRQTLLRKHSRSTEKHSKQSSVDSTGVCALAAVLVAA